LSNAIFNSIKKYIGGIKIKKIAAILIIGILVLSISSASAIILPKAGNLVNRAPLKINNKLTQKNTFLDSTEGNFTGKFAKKNDTGYIILGSLNGTYNKSSNYTGTFSGAWNTTNGSISGTMDGWFWGYVFLGTIKSDNSSYWFVGLYRVNTTSNKFYAVSVIFDSSYIIRYAAGTFT